MTTKEFEVLEKLLGDDIGRPEIYPTEYTHSKRLIEFKGDLMVLQHLSNKIVVLHSISNGEFTKSAGMPVVEIKPPLVHYTPYMIQNYLVDTLKSIICNRKFRLTKSGDMYEFKCQEVDIDLYFNGNMRDKIKVTYHWGLYLTNNSESIKYKVVTFDTDHIRMEHSNETFDITLMQE